MPDIPYKVLAPDGKPISFMGPDDATPEEIGKAAEQVFLLSKNPELTAGNGENSVEFDAGQGFKKSFNLGSSIEVPKRTSAPKPGLFMTGMPWNTYEEGSTVPVSTRGIAGMAPTPQDKKAYYEMEYGKGNYINAGNGNELVKIPSDNGEKWIPVNPKGFDLGDIAAITGDVPQLAAGVAGALAATPTIPGKVMKLVAASGLGALASQAVGAGRDALWRSAVTKTDVDPAEIAGRRIIEGGVETVAGVGIPLVAKGVTSLVTKNPLAKGIKNEMEKAAKVLIDKGIVAKNADELPGAVQAYGGPPEINKNQAGEMLAKGMNDMDARLRNSSTNLASQAQVDIASRAAEQTAKVFPQVVDAPTVGRAVRGGVRTFITETQERVGALYDKAYSVIEKAGGDGFIVNLNNTNAAINRAMKDLPRTADGGVSSFFEPLVRMQNELASISGISQRLNVARNIRSSIGESMSNGTGVFKDLPKKTASRLYRTLSQDIDRSVAAYSGEGAEILKRANSQYKELVQPFEENNILSRLVKDKGGFQNDEDVIDALVNGGTNDWQAIGKVLGNSPVMQQTRKAAVQRIFQGAETKVAGKEVLDISVISSRLKGMSPDKKTAIFGDKKTWQSIEGMGREFKIAQSSLFTKASLPTLPEAQEALRLAMGGEVAIATQSLRRAYRAAAARRDNVAESLTSQIKNGNTRIVTENPSLFVDEVIFNENTGSGTIKQLIKRLAPGDRKKVGDLVYEEIFEKTKESSTSLLGKNLRTHSPEKLRNMIFGSKDRADAMREIVGQDRFEAIEAWTRYTSAQALDAIRMQPYGGNELARTLALAPYKTIFAARLTSYVLQKTAGGVLFKSATPDMIKKFAKVRLMQDEPIYTASAIAATQSVLKNPLYWNYKESLEGFTEEQKKLLDEYWTSPSEGAKAYLIGMPSRFSRDPNSF